MDIKALIKKRATCKAKLTQFKNYLDTAQSCDRLSRLQINELNVRLAKIEELYTDFDNIQSEIENLSDIPEDQYRDRETFETQYFGAIALARDVLVRHDEGSADSASVTGSITAHRGGPKIKLPTIHLPTFSGSYHDWLEFHDTFNSLIHSDISIPKINKFHYLRAALKDTAASIIQSLDFSSENYDVAWDILCDRYNNKRLLVNNHLQAIFNIETINKESSKALRNLIDTVNKNLRALQSLKLPTDHWDIIIIHIISNKLDSVSNREWETFRNTLKELPTLKEFTDFLKNRSDLLETMEESYSKRRHSDVTNNRQKSMVVRSRSSLTNETYICPLCKDNHAIYRCPKFKSLSIEMRIKKVKDLKLCSNCLRQGHNLSACKLGPCRICNKLHNSLLHLQNATTSTQSAGTVVLCAAPSSSTPPPPSPPPLPQSPETQNNISNHNNDVALSAINKSCVLLSTALIQVQDSSGQKQTIRALLDSGSTASFITESLCAKLNLPTASTSSVVEGLNSQLSHLNKRCDVIISSLISTYKENINCFVVPTITQFLPTTQINYSLLNIPKNITLADPTFNIPAKVDMLLGADIFWSVLCSQNISLGKGKPTLSKTKFGWLISGLVHNQTSSLTVHCNHITLRNDDQLNKQLTQFFEYENIPTHKQMSKEEQKCEQSFIENTKRESDGHFVVSIPLKESPEKLGDSYQQALSRFLSLERRFSKDPSFKNLYCDFIREYIKLGHMTENTNKNSDTYTYLLPHHGVLRETSLTTKLRAVFDASAVTTSGLSFNDIQMVGPTVQDDLLSILIRLRQHKYVVTADVEKMYRMVKVEEQQRQLQQILWRFEPHEELKQYTLNTVTYGTASAPFLATRCLKQLGLECPDKVVSEVIQHDMYVDDLITGADNIEELKNICKALIIQLASGKFHLRKWHSNHPNIINELFTESSSDDLLNLSNDEHSKTLGLLWSCKEDTLLFSVNLKQNTNITKRTILSVMSQIYDPLGLINPCILIAKTILQRLWASKVSWDEPVSTEFEKSWHKFIDSLTYLNTIRVPRLVVADNPKTIEIHAFSDASTQAYSACIYLRTISENGNVSVRLVMAKSRVAPIKPSTIPRLELCGALLAAQLSEKVKSSLRLHIDKITYWCDSTIVISWINSTKSHLLKAYVFNRIQEILEVSDPSAWRYVPTSLNPADIGSRGSDAKQLQNCQLWWNGPTFLTQREEEWPQQPSRTTETDLPEFKALCNFTTEQTDYKTHYANCINRFSSFTKLQRVIAYVQRFIHNYFNPQDKRTGYLKISELNSSLNSLCRFVQLEEFEKEYLTLQNNRNLPAKCRLLNLNAFYNSNDRLLRVGGRLSNSFYDFDTKHPILLPSAHHLTLLLLRHYHFILLHAGPQLLLATIRHKFWILGGRNLARKVVHGCTKCCRFSGKVKQPIMGNLPPQRLHADFPFINTAVDYAGPVMILNRKGRGSQLIKSYLCIFICMAIKAVHIELVTDMTSETYLAALSRFIARRGKPTNIYSDNGKCFVGALKELTKFLKQNSDYICAQVADMSINFKFAPPYSPHFNGLAEGAVKSVKHHLKRSVSLANLTYEQMNTVLIQIEAILNSRPLTPLSSNPADLTALTPSHFLIGRTITLLPSPQVKETAATHTLSQYMRTQQIKLHFWNRFYKEYISELQTRRKWCKQGQDLQLGEMVLIKDDQLPPNRWLLGRVTALHPGSDGVTRVADVVTTSGTLRRAFNRLCPLPALNQSFTPGAAAC